MRPRILRGTSRGQVLVIASIAMLVLVSMAGLAIDGGRGYWERRQAQNAAEHAALAAAWEHCHPEVAGSPDPTAAAVEAATDNGFTHDGVTTWVETSGSSGMYTVRVRSQLRTTFAAIMGFQTISAAGKAVAECTSTSGEGFALFAGGDNCDKQIEFAGQDNVINGAMHSNGNVHVSGGPNTFNGAVTYVDAPLEGSGSGNVYNPAHAQSSPEPWPVEFNLADYKALALQSPTDNMHYDEAGNINTSYINTHGSGLYYSTKKIDLGSVGSDLLSLTLVSEQEVVISGSDLRLQPFKHNLLAFSKPQPTWSLDERCGKEGVLLSGSNNDWKGFIYAPDARVKLEGSSNNTLIGSVISWSIYLSGQALNNTADPSFLAGPPELRLIE